jgi:hypothetical protein
MRLLGTSLCYIALRRPWADQAKKFPIFRRLTIIMLYSIFCHYISDYKISDFKSFLPGLGGRLLALVTVAAHRQRIRFEKYFWRQ